MNYTFEISNQPRTTWDNEIQSYDFPEIYQTTFYGEYLRWGGRFPQYISILENGNLIGNCLVDSSKDKIASWSYGPLLKTEKSDCQEKILEEFLIFLKKSGFIAVENAKTRKYYDPHSTFNEKSDLYSKIGESPYIDIRQDIEEILNSFDRAVRKNINKCVRNEVEVIISDDATFLEPYIKILTWFRTSRNFDMPTFYPNAETMKIFNNPITSMRIALAKIDGQFLAGRGIVTIGNVMVGIALATSKESKISKLPVNDYLIFKAVEFYKQKGIDFYDLAGGERDPSDSKKKGIMLYKQQFATGNAPFGMIDRVILSPAWYPLALERKIKYILSK